MIWLVVKYTDGTRTCHAFAQALLYTVEGRVHVHGDALCGVQFTDDRSGARVDVVCALLCDESDGRCEGCGTAMGSPTPGGLGPSRGGPVTGKELRGFSLPITDRGEVDG